MVLVKYLESFLMRSKMDGLAQCFPAIVTLRLSAHSLERALLSGSQRRHQGKWFLMNRTRV